MSRHVIRDGGFIDINLTLRGPLEERLNSHAGARDLRPDVLVARIVEHILREDLVAAVLDDGK